MAELVEIVSADDPRLADYRNLRDVELRKHLEAEHGLFLAEGEKVVRRAVEAGHRPRSFLMAPRWLASQSRICSSLPFAAISTCPRLADRIKARRGRLVQAQPRP